MKILLRALRLCFVITLLFVASFGVGVFGYHDRYRDKRVTTEQVEKDELED